MFWLNIAIQAVPSACSSRPPVGSVALRSNTPMLSRPRKPPSNTLWPEGSLRFTHQVKFSSSLREALLQERQVHLAEVGLQVVQEQSREGVDRGVHVAEVPLVGRHLAARVQVLPGQHQVDLALREVRVDHGQRDAVERQVPGGVPRVLPLVGHGHDVVVDHVEPRLVAGPPPGRRPQRVDVALAQPAVDVEVVALLGPQHPGQRLAHDRLGIVGHRRRRDGLVELVRLGPPPRDQLIGVGERRHERLRALASEPHQHRGLPAGRHDQPDVRRHLGPLAVGIHGVRAVQEVVADAVLGEARRGLGAEYPRRVRFVLAEQQGRFRLGVEVENAELVVLGPDDRMCRLDAGEPGLGLTVSPRPGVAEPQRRQHVQRRRPATSGCAR